MAAGGPLQSCRCSHDAVSVTGFFSSEWFHQNRFLPVGNLESMVQLSYAMNMHPADKRLELIGDELAYLLDEIQLSFWVDFTERDIIEATTVGDLFDRVVNKMGQFESPRCLTSAAFYRLRRSLAEVSGLDPHSLRRDTQLRNLLSRSTQCKWWDAIERDLRLRIPACR